MTTAATLRAEKRATFGSRTSRKLRDAGRIPATIQGAGKDNVAFSIEVREFLTHRRRHAHIYEVDLGAGPELALIRELQWDPLGETVLHVEFRRVLRGQRTEVPVELEFVGQPKGGVLNHLVTHVLVLCDPLEIPDSIPVDIAGMEPGHPLHARDLKLPPGVDLAVPPETNIAVVVIQKEEPTAAELAAAAAAAAPVAEGAAAAAPAAAGAAPGAAAPAAAAGGKAPAAGAEAKPKAGSEPKAKGGKGGKGE